MIEEYWMDREEFQKLSSFRFVLLFCGGSVGVFFMCLDSKDESTSEAGFDEATQASIYEHWTNCMEAMRGQAHVGMD